MEVTAIHTYSAELHVEVPNLQTIQMTLIHTYSAEFYVEVPNLQSIEIPNPGPIDLHASENC